MGKSEYKWSCSAAEYHYGCWIGDFAFSTMPRKRKIWKISFRWCSEHAYSLKQCAMPCSSQHSLMLLGSTDTSPSAQGPPLPGGKDKGKEREIFLKPVVKITYGQGNIPSLLLPLINTENLAASIVPLLQWEEGLLPWSLQSIRATAGTQWVSECPVLP